MAEAKKDGNYQSTLIAVSSVDGLTPVTVYADPTTHRLKVDLSGGGSGDVVGPAGATANAVPRFSGVSGLLLKNSGVIVSDANAMSGVASLTIDASGSLLFGAVSIISDVAGTTTLSNIDAIDATTESTIEAAIDTLANLTSIQGRTVTLADAGVNAIFGWDDVASAYENLTQAEVLAIIGDSTATAKGVVELATDAETVTGTDTVRATTPANITAKMSAPGTIGNTTPGNITGLIITANTSFMPDANDGAVLGAGATSFSDLFLATGGVINWNNGTTLWYERTAGNLTLENPTALAVGPILEIFQNSASPAVSDVIGEINFLGRNSAAAIYNYGAIKTIILDPVSTSEDSKMVFAVSTASGGAANKMELTGAALYPSANDGLALGNTTNQFADLFVASGANIDFANNNVTIIHSAGILTINPGELRISNPGTGTTAVVTNNGTQTLVNKRITERTGTTASSATPTINTDNVSFYSLTAQAADITSFTTNLSGTPTEAQTLWIAITGTAARAITWGASFEASTVALPTTTVTTNRLDVGFVWNTVTNKWRCVASC